MKNYHCCATCRHFSIRREGDSIRSQCNRLGYDTKSHYQFRCWNPRPDIVEKMAGRDDNQELSSDDRRDDSKDEGRDDIKDDSRDDSKEKSRDDSKDESRDDRINERIEE